MRGRKPKPTALKILEGVQNDRINHSEPIPPSGRPEPFAHLDALAKDEWQRMCDLLQGMGLLSLADGPALMCYCECFSKWLRARHEVQKHGMLVESTTDVIRKNKIVATNVSGRSKPAIDGRIRSFQNQPL